LIGQDGRQIFHASRQLFAAGAQYGQIGQLLHGRLENPRQSWFGKQRARARIAQDKRQFPRLGLTVDSDEDAARQQDPENRSRALPTVIHKNDHPVAALNAARSQRVGEATGVIRYFTVAHPRICADQCKVLRAAGGGDEQDVLKQARDGDHGQ